jgi:hypothetical protein
MQVGLATKKLGGNLAFQSLSYGFTVFPILGPLIGAAIIMVMLVIAVTFNYLYTQARRTEKRALSQKSLTSVSVNNFLH